MLTIAWRSIRDAPRGCVFFPLRLRGELSAC